MAGKPSKKRLKGIEIARKQVERAVIEASRTVRNMVDGSDPGSDERYADVTVRQKAALLLAGKFLDAERAKVEGAGPRVVAPIFLMPQLQSNQQWEALAAHVEATGELPPVEERPADQVIDVEATSADDSSKH